MGITSMGIFGFLSRAHIEHQTTTDKAIAEMQVIQNKIDRENVSIKRQQEYISSLEKRSSSTSSSSRIDIDSENQKIRDITEQMNKDILFEQERIAKENQTLSKLNIDMQDLEKSSGGLFSNKSKKIEALKLEQKPLRESITSRISKYNENIDSFRSDANSKIQNIEEKISQFRNQTAQKDISIKPQIDEHTTKISDAHGRIDELEAQKIGFSDNARKLEAEIGPVKYVAEAIADFTGKEFDVSQAVRIVILILVLVFDPLAILLVIAANISIEKYMPKSNKRYNKLESSIKTLEEKRDEMLPVIESLESDIKLKTEESANLKSSEEELSLIKIQLEDRQSQLNSIEQSKNEKLSDLEKIKQSIEEVSNRLESEKTKYTEDRRSIDKQKQKLEFDKEKLSAEESILDHKKLELESISQKNTEAIKSQEEILTHLNTEKDKAAEEKKQFTETSELLKSEIESRQKLISQLKETYQNSINTSNIVDILKQSKMNDMSNIDDEGNRSLCIADSKNRVHQFIIPKQHVNLPNSYFHQTVKSLESVLDPEDLEHEYKLAIKKYISFNIPDYNCLT
jgi:chromosome segregation ATPase